MKQILVLDDDETLARLVIILPGVEVTFASRYANNDADPRQAFLTKIIRETSKQKFDLVILADDNGAGLEILGAICGESKKATVIVSDRTIDQKTAARYVERGAKECINRVELAMSLKRRLDIEE